MGLERYSLDERIGGGGMAEVFRARTRGSMGVEKEVVVKRVRRELANDERFVQMFLDEARLSLMLDHANVVQVFELGENEGDYLLVMEYVRGANLAQVLAAAGCRLPPAIAARIGAEVCRGLSYAHRKRDVEGRPLAIVHRDLSPQNILLSVEGEVKVSDFGIARARGGANTTLHGELKGKFSYMSPEQTVGDPLDARSDLFSLGTILYEMLAGENPFGPATDAGTLARVRACDAPSIGEVEPEVPPLFAQVVDRAMARDPGDRFADAEEMLAVLERCVRESQAPARARDIAEWVMRATTGSGDRARRPVRLDDAIEAAFGAEVGSVPGGVTMNTTTAAARRAGGLDGLRRWGGALAGAAALLAVVAVAWLVFTGPEPDADSDPGSEVEAVIPERGSSSAGAEASAHTTLATASDDRGETRGPATVQADADDSADALATGAPGAVYSPPIESGRPLRTGDAAGRGKGKGKGTARGHTAHTPASVTPAAPGILRLGSRPGWAKVLIDGREHGTTPLALKLPVGTYEVILIGAKGTRRVATLKVRAGETTRYVAEGM